MTSTGRKSKRPPNKGSRILLEHENDTLFTLIGRDCIVRFNRYYFINLFLCFFKSLAAGVVQLLRAEQPNASVWTKKYVGVVALIKDYEKRAYFLRLFDLQRGRLWEQMLYVYIYF